jgi:hypothetical protein
VLRALTKEFGWRRVVEEEIGPVEASPELAREAVLQIGVIFGAKRRFCGVKDCLEVLNRKPLKNCDRRRPSEVLSMADQAAVVRVLQPNAWRRRPNAEPSLGTKPICDCFEPDSGQTGNSYRLRVFLTEALEKRGDRYDGRNRNSWRGLSEKSHPTVDRFMRNEIVLLRTKRNLPGNNERKVKHKQEAVNRKSKK